MKNQKKEYSILKAFSVSDDPNQPFDPINVIKCAESQGVRITESDIVYANQLIVTAANYFLVPVGQTLSKKRGHDCLNVRQLFFHFMMTRTKLPQKVVGAFITNRDGYGRDHSTVIHSLEKHKQFLFRGHTEMDYMECFFMLYAQSLNRPIIHRTSDCVKKLIESEEAYVKKWGNHYPVKDLVKGEAVPLTTTSDAMPGGELTSDERIMRQEIKLIFEFMGLKADHIIDNFYSYGRQELIDKKEAAREKQKRAK